MSGLPVRNWSDTIRGTDFRSVFFFAQVRCTDFLTRFFWFGPWYWKSSCPVRKISTDQYRYWFWVRFAHPWVNEMTGVYENITVIFRRTLFRIIRLKFWKKNVQFLTKIVRTPFENDPKMTNSGHKLLKWPF